MINFYRDIAEDTYRRGKTTFKIHDLNGNEFSVMMTMNSTVYELIQEIHYK